MERAQFGFPWWVFFTSSLKELPLQNSVKLAKFPGNPRDTSFGILGIQGREKSGLIPSLALHKERGCFVYVLWGLAVLISLWYGIMLMKDMLHEGINPSTWENGS